MLIIRPIGPCKINTESPPTVVDVRPGSHLSAHVPFQFPAGVHGTISIGLGSGFNSNVAGFQSCSYQAWFTHGRRRVEAR